MRECNSQNIYMKTIRWEITSKCNLSCKHCIVGKLRREDIDLIEAKAIVDILVKKGIKEISFTTKEPFMFEGFMELLDYCTINNIYFSIITNGTLLDEKKLKKLYELNLKYICISLDGWVKKDNDLIRGNGTFKKIEDILSLIQHYNNTYLKYIPVYIQTLITQNNLKNINQLDSFYNKYPDFILSLGLIMEYGNAENEKNLIIDNLIDYKQSIIQEIKKLKGKVYFKDSSYYETVFDNFIFDLNNKPLIPHCSINNDYFTILSDGRLCKCIMLLDEKINTKFQILYPNIKEKFEDKTKYELFKYKYKENNVCSECKVAENCNLCYLIIENEDLLNKQINNCMIYKNKINKIVEDIISDKLKIRLSKNFALSENEIYIFSNDYSVEKINLNNLEQSAIQAVMNNSLENFILKNNINSVKETISSLIYKNILVKM